MHLLFYKIELMKVLMLFFLIFYFKYFYFRLHRSEIIDNEKQKFTRSVSLDRFTKLYDVSREYDSKKEELRKS